MRRSLSLAAALLVLARGGGAFGDPPAPPPLVADPIVALEEAFLDERFDDVFGLTANDRFEPLMLVTEFWRPRAVVRGTPPAPTPLLARRMTWVRAGGRGPYPMPAADETDVFPRITGLVLDRLRRESSGAAGLPEGSPLAALRDSTVQEFLRLDMKPALRGPDPGARTADEKALAERVREVARRNLWIALLGVAGLLVAAGGWLFATRPRRPVGGGGG